MPTRLAIFFGAAWLVSLLFVAYYFRYAPIPGGSGGLALVWDRLSGRACLAPTPTSDLGGIACTVDELKDLVPPVSPLTSAAPTGNDCEARRLQMLAAGAPLAEVDAYVDQKTREYRQAGMSASQAAQHWCGR